MRSLPQGTVLEAQLVPPGGTELRGEEDDRRIDSIGIGSIEGIITQYGKKDGRDI
jgi:hypothetical protein